MYGQGSNINFIPNSLFEKFPNLKSLAIFNQINLTGLESKYFLNASKLQTLIIHKSNIKVLEERLFANAENIEYINLVNSSIDIIHKLAFDGLPNLQQLSLKNNKITKINSKTFSNITSLKYLNLENNICINKVYIIANQNFTEVEKDLKQNCTEIPKLIIETLPITENTKLSSITVATPVPTTAKPSAEKVLKENTTEKLRLSLQEEELINLIQKNMPKPIIETLPITENTQLSSVSVATPVPTTTKPSTENVLKENTTVKLRLSLQEEERTSLIQKTMAFLSINITNLETENANLTISLTALENKTIIIEENSNKKLESIKDNFQNKFNTMNESSQALSKKIEYLLARQTDSWMIGLMGTITTILTIVGIVMILFMCKKIKLMNNQELAKTKQDSSPCNVTAMKRFSQSSW